MPYGLVLRYALLVTTIGAGWALRTLGPTALAFAPPAPTAPAPLLAYPGAGGAGRYTSGGRGTTAVPTTVLEVTRLADDNAPGSLRYAVQLSQQKAPFRTIVFRVGGTVHLLSPLNITTNNITLAGQTAPGGGICLADYPVTVRGHNIVVRFIRFRLGDRYQNQGQVDGAGGDDAFGGQGSHRLIVDHCSMSWSTDECFSVYGGDSVTLSWNLMGPPLNYSYHFEKGDQDFEHHGYGGIWGGQHASLHHNLWVHCNSRTPRFQGSRYTHPAGYENCDYRNNVIYDWGENNVYAGEGGNYNVVNNYYRPGPSTSARSRQQLLNPYKLDKGPNPLPYGKFYVAGNHQEASPEATRHNWRGVVMQDGTPADTTLAQAAVPFDLGPVTTQLAPQAYELVLAGAGATRPRRDTLDERLVREVRTRTGRLIDVQGGHPHGTPYAVSQSAWPVLAPGTALVDTDHDGMPDAWEKAHGLNPASAADRAKAGAGGYLMLEAYLNELAGQ